MPWLSILVKLVNLHFDWASPHQRCTGQVLAHLPVLEQLLMQSTWSTGEIIIIIVTRIIITINMVDRLIIVIVVMTRIISITMMMKNDQAQDDLECRPRLVLLHHSSWWGNPSRTGKPHPILLFIQPTPRITLSVCSLVTFFTPSNALAQCIAHPSSSCVSAGWPCLRPLVGDQRARR